LSSKTDAFLSSVISYFMKSGWKVVEKVKLRGRVADIVAMRGNEIAAVEVKTDTSKIELGIEAALHFRNIVNYSYLALPKGRSSKELSEACKHLGIGLLLIDGNSVAEEVEAAYGKALPSIKKALLREDAKEREVTLVSSLYRLFRSRSLTVILKLLLNPSSEFHINGIARRTGLSPSTVLKECYNLFSLGLVTKEVKGNLVLFRVKRDSLIFDELKRIFLKYEFVDVLLSKSLLKGSIKYALIFGSFAKGNEEQSSDVDLLIVGYMDEDKLLKEISGMEKEIGREIHYILWTEDEFHEKVKKQIPLLREIAKTNIIMLVGEKDEFIRVIKQGFD
jgi:predicted nucleotidyltransferase